MKNEFYPLQANYYLEMEFKKRKERRPFYSLRAFARDLGIGASTLSEVLSGKTALSFERIQQLSKKMGLSEKQMNHWYDLIVVAHSKSRQKIKSAQQSLKQKKLNEDLFKVISDWYYLAILELIEIASQSTVESVSNTLGLKKSVCSKAITRMLKLGFIYQEGDFYHPALTDFIVGNELPSMAIKKFHLQTLQKAKQALLSKPLSERDFQSMVFSIRQQDMENFRKDIYDQLLPVIKKYEAKEKKSLVCNLSYQLFDLGRLENN